MRLIRWSYRFAVVFVVSMFFVPQIHATDGLMALNIEQIPHTEIVAIASGASSIWVATKTGLFKKSHGLWSQLKINKEIVSNNVRKIFVDSKDNVWISYDDWESGVSVFSTANGWRHFILPRNVLISSFAEMPSGEIIVGSHIERGGIYVLRNSEFVVADFFPQEIHVTDLAITNRGLLIVGTLYNGFFVYDNQIGVLSQYSTHVYSDDSVYHKLPLPFPSVKQIKVASDDGLWLLGEDGDKQLAYISPNLLSVHAFGGDSGLSLGDIYQIAIDDSDRLWIAGKAGLQLRENNKFTTPDITMDTDDDILTIYPNKLGQVFLGKRFSGLYVLTFSKSKLRSIRIRNLHVSAGAKEAELFYDPMRELVKAGSEIYVYISDDGGKNFNRSFKLNNIKAGHVRIKGLHTGRVYYLKLVAQTRDGQKIDSGVVHFAANAGSKIKPFANAGADLSALIYDKVSLDGSASTVATKKANYNWSFVSGPVQDVKIYNNGAVRAWFYPDVEGEYVFQLNVRDSLGQVGVADTVLVNVAGRVLKDPIAIITSKNYAFVGDPIVLDGSTSYFATKKVKFRWKLVSGPINKVLFDKTNIVRPIFRSYLPGEYTFSLTVIDDTGQESIPVYTKINILKKQEDSLFKDLGNDDPEIGDFLKLSKRGVIGGFQDGTIRPDAFVTRAEFLKMLLKAFDIQQSDNMDFDFKDVAVRDWYALYIKSALSLGLINNSDYFYPQRSISKVEALKMLYKIKQIGPLPKLTVDLLDVDDDDWFSGYVAESFLDGLYVVPRNKEFRPDEQLKRRDVVRLLAQTI